MSNGLIFTQRFDLSQVTSRFADKNAAHFIGGGFKSFWVSSASSPDFSARMIFEPHTGSDSGTGLKLGLNMALTLSQVFSTACIEVDLAQPNQWIEITFSASESLSVGSVSVDLKVPSSPAELKVGEVSVPNDGSHFVLGFGSYLESNGQLILNHGVFGSNGYIFPRMSPFLTGVIRGPSSSSANTYRVPPGYRMIPLSWETVNESSFTFAAPTGICLFHFRAGVDNTVLDTTNDVFDIRVLGSAQKETSKGFAITSFNDGFVNQGESFGIYKGMNNITAANPIGSELKIRVLVKLERI